jgi:hypothetical protein
MRTTLTVDDNLMQLLREAAFKRGLPLKAIVNRALRAGLEVLENPQQPAPPYVPTTHAMGQARGVNLDKALAVAAALEDDETVRKLQLRK